jgi:hypothetical protein
VAKTEENGEIDPNGPLAAHAESFVTGRDFQPRSASSRTTADDNRFFLADEGD